MNDNERVPADVICAHGDANGWIVADQQVLVVCLTRYRGSPPGKHLHACYLKADAAAACSNKSHRRSRAIAT